MIFPPEFPFLHCCLLHSFSFAVRASNNRNVLLFHSFVGLTCGLNWVVFLRSHWAEIKVSAEVVIISETQGPFSCALAVGIIQFLLGVALSFLLSYWVLNGSHSQSLEVASHDFL